MLQIIGRLIPTPQDVSIAGYSIAAHLNTLLSQPTTDAEEPQTLLVPVFATALCNADGSFLVQFEFEGEPKTPVTLIASAPNGVQISRTEFSLSQIENPLDIEIQALPPIPVEASTDPTMGQRIRLIGQVIDLQGRSIPTGLPVVIWGVPAAIPTVETGEDVAHSERPLLIAHTQVNGGFSGDWTSIVLQEAFGRVSGGKALPILLDSTGRIPVELLLVLNIDEIPPQPMADDECACADRPPRAPDAIDLTANPQAFSQDLGGGCMDLTMPNRALEEFSYFTVVRTTKPAIQSVTLGVRRLVPNELLTDLLGVTLADLHFNRRSSLALSVPNARRALGNLSLDLENAINLVRGDSPPTFEQIERAVWLSEVDATKRLIHSGLQDQTGRVELNANSAIDWDETPTIHLAIEIAHGHILRYREVWRADGYSLGDLLYSLPLAPGQRRRVAVVDWNRQTSSTREEQLESEEDLDALVTHDRDIREIVGSSLHEETSGGSRNTTWGVAGGIGAGFIGSGFGIFGGVAGGAGGSDTTSWQRSSRQFSANSLQQLRDRVGQRASAVRSQHSTVVQTVAQNETVRAETEIVANYNHCHAITIEYFEVLRHFLITHELADVQECVFVPLPMTDFTRAKALRWREVLSRYLKDRRLLGGFESIERVIDNWVGWDFPISRYSEEAPENMQGELRISFLLPRPRDAADGQYQVEMWKPFSSFLPIDTLELHTAKLNTLVAADRDRVFRNEIAPEIASNLVQKLTFAYVSSDGSETTISMDASLVSRYQEGTPLYISLNPAGSLPNVPRESIAYFKIGYQGPALPPDARLIVHSGRVRYSTDHITTLLFDAPRILDDLNVADSVLVATPTSQRELRNPRQEDLERSEALVNHLNAHLEYYHQAIWISLDAQRRYMLLDAIILPATGSRALSVAGVCINELIGIVGNSLVLPLAPGQKLDPTIELVDEEGKLVRLEDAYQTPSTPPLRVSIPTRGVYAEAIAGECNACEQIDDSRYWRWTTAGQLALPEIETVSTGGRGSEEPDLTPTPLPAPLVSIQNAPELPQPFGLGDAFGLLSKPDLFRDITGLEGTQKNAQAAFEGALAAASAIGSEAANLARQNELGRNGERMLSRIEQSKRDGLLTPEAAQDLATSALGALIGDPKTKTEEPNKDETVNKVIDEAAQTSKADIKVSNADETVEVSFEDDSPVIGAGGIAPGRIDIVLHITEDLVTEEIVLRSRTVQAQDTLAKVKAQFTAAEYASLESRHLVFANTADPTKAQFEQRLRIIYPTSPAKPNVIAGKGRLPVVVLVHGQHESWEIGNVPNHEGYTYLQQELARQNIISVSVDTNLANITDSLVEMRAKMIFTALDKLRALDQKARSIFFGRLDFSNVGLIGHSRGGDAVIRAAKMNTAKQPASRYGIRMVCSLAPTDFTGTLITTDVMKLTPADTSFFGVIYGGLDGDVSGTGGAKHFTGTGFRHYDRATCDKAMVFIEHCNHNRFNDTWATDDSRMAAADLAPLGRLLSRPNHRQLAIEYIGGMVRFILQKEIQQRGLFTGSKTNTLAAGVSLQWSFGERVLLMDNMEDPAVPTIGTRTLSNAVVEKMQDIKIGLRNLAQETNHQTSVVKVDPGLPGPVASVYRLNLTGPHRDWSSFDGLSLRVCADCDLTDATTISASLLPDFVLTITDANGTSSNFATNPLPSEKPFMNKLRKPIFHQISTGENCSVIHLETLEGDLALVRLDPAGADLTQITLVELTPPPGLPKEIFFDNLLLRRF